MLLLSSCQSYFYFPLKEKLFDPARIGMKPEDIFLQTKSGNTIHAWYFASTQKESKGTVLFFHGNAENITSHFLMFHWLPNQGYNYLIFDYPGYGQSTGEPTPENTVEAGIAAAEWLHESRETRPLIIYGHSLGGIVALKAVEEIKDTVPLRNVIIEASFPSYQGMGRNVLSRQWWTWIFQPLTYVLLSDSQAPKEIARVSPIPMLFISGTDDVAVEPKNTQKLYDKAASPKEIWMIPGGRHGNLYEVNDRALREQLMGYLSKTSTASN